MPIMYLLILRMFTDFNFEFINFWLPEYREDLTDAHTSARSVCHRPRFKQERQPTINMQAYCSVKPGPPAGVI